MKLEVLKGEEWKEKRRKADSEVSGGSDIREELILEDELVLSERCTEDGRPGPLRFFEGRPTERPEPGVENKGPSSMLSQEPPILLVIERFSSDGESNLRILHCGASSREVRS